METSYVACRFISIKINYSDYPKILISRINEVYGFFSNKYCYRHILLKKKINFIEDVCFAAITLVIVLKLFL